MTESPLFNVHTHRFDNHALIHIDALNCQIPKDVNLNNYWFSIGIHPWDTERINISEVPILLARCFEEIHPIAIGECGVDRLRGASIDIQLTVFEQHVEFATKKNLPVIVHSVRAISDILPILKKYNTTTFVFHNYHANWIQTEALLQLNCFFSFGTSILKPNEKLLEVIRRIPSHRLLLETDDEDPDLLMSVLQQLAIIRKTKSEMLEIEIRKNVDFVFFKSVKHG
ncbi:MAG: TatD family hydrolase [Salinivirgaceae bacterium]|nr:TatD family hydrolase [Salinivirgaceae bacterium]